MQSKTDTVQMSFYVSLGLTTPNTTAAITPGKFYEDVNDIFEVPNQTTKLSFIITTDNIYMFNFESVIINLLDYVFFSLP